MNAPNPLSELPMGFGMALVQQPEAMQRFATMPQAQKEEVLARVRSVQSKKEMQALVSSIF